MCSYSLCPITNTPSPCTTTAIYTAPASTKSTTNVSASHSSNSKPFHAACQVVVPLSRRRLQTIQTATHLTTLPDIASRPLQRRMQASSRTSEYARSASKRYKRNANSNAMAARKTNTQQLMRAGKTCQINQRPAHCLNPLATNLAIAHRKVPNSLSFQ